MAIDGSGNVGIGTTSPAATLDVSGDAAFGGKVGIGAVPSSFKLMLRGAGTGFYTGIGLYTDEGAPDNGFMSIDICETDVGCINVSDSVGSQDLALQTNLGSVGIGTTAPTSKLTVADGLKTGDSSLALFKSTDASPITLNIGIIGSGTAANQGIFFDATEPTVSDDRPITLQRYGGSVGIGTTTPGGYKLYVAGNAYTTGTWGSSDARWKKNIDPLENSLDKVARLNGVNFEWDIDRYPEKGFEKGRQVGLIAQEVENVVPELVRTDEDGYKSVSYEKLSAVLVEAVKELKAENDALRTNNDALEARLARLETLLDVEQ